ncbi:MAG TPA: outer membrane lipoprotein LolB [Candidatus Paenalcaligenes intestinipullorum]|uniref:Outer-membrane lipoprotein LolB n=1 Tax=Candidatus Paenalcaligenes intestinipullorum TaxID=2838718 RepID=A0A9D2U8V7_9BURK|nr:outer membrane lipoprotein LolB [Candidatus Paenalcaligenes intestinipullorum]
MFSFLNFLARRRGFFALGLTAIVVFGGLAGCASTPDLSAEAAHAEFVRSGRFAVSVVEVTGKRDAVQGGFTWVDTGTQLSLNLTNPMGSVLAQVLVQPKGAVLARPDGSTEYASDPDALVEQLLGHPIPVAKLRTWIRGQAEQQAQKTAYQDDQLVGFEQDGWRVGLSRYDAKGPKLLTMDRHQSMGHITVRLVVDQ